MSPVYLNQRTDSPEAPRGWRKPSIYPQTPILAAIAAEKGRTRA